MEIKTFVKRFEEKKLVPTGNVIEEIIYMVGNAEFRTFEEAEAFAGRQKRRDLYFRIRNIEDLSFIGSDCVFYYVSNEDEKLALVENIFNLMNPGFLDDFKTPGWVMVQTINEYDEFGHQGQNWLNHPPIDKLQELIDVLSGKE